MPPRRTKRSLSSASATSASAAGVGAAVITRPPSRTRRRPRPASQSDDERDGDRPDRSASHSPRDGHPPAVGSAHCGVSADRGGGGGGDGDKPPGSIITTTSSSSNIARRRPRKSSASASSRFSPSTRSNTPPVAAAATTTSTTNTASRSPPSPTAAPRPVPGTSSSRRRNPSPASSVSSSSSSSSASASSLSSRSGAATSAPNTPPDAVAAPLRLTRRSSTGGHHLVPLPHSAGLQLSYGGGTNGAFKGSSSNGSGNGGLPSSRSRRLPGSWVTDSEPSIADSLSLSSASAAAPETYYSASAPGFPKPIPYPPFVPPLVPMMPQMHMVPQHRRRDRDSRAERELREPKAEPRVRELPEKGETPDSKEKDVKLEPKEQKEPKPESKPPRELSDFEQKYLVTDDSPNPPDPPDDSPRPSALDQLAQLKTKVRAFLDQHWPSKPKLPPLSALTQQPAKAAPPKTAPKAAPKPAPKPAGPSALAILRDSVWPTVQRQAIAVLSSPSLSAPWSGSVAAPSPSHMLYADEELPPVYRRFEALNHRVLRHVHDELAQLEEDLSIVDDLDEMHHAALAADPVDLAFHHHNNRLSLHPRPQKLPPAEHAALTAKRRDLLARITTQTEAYNRSLYAFRKVLHNVPRASARDVHAYRRWLHSHPRYGGGAATGYAYSGSAAGAGAGAGAGVGSGLGSSSSSSSSSSAAGGSTTSRRLADARFLHHDADLILLTTHGISRNPVFSTITCGLGAVLVPLLAFGVIREFFGRLLVVAAVGCGLAWLSGHGPPGNEYLVLDPRDACRFAVGYLGVMSLAALIVG